MQHLNSANEVEEGYENAEDYNDGTGEAFENEAAPATTEILEDSSNAPADADSDADADADADAVDADADADAEAYTDDLHEFADGDEGGDYVDYEDYTADDDGQFGEDPSQAFGEADSGRDAYDPHVSLDEAGQLDVPEVHEVESPEHFEGKSSHAYFDHPSRTDRKYSTDFPSTDEPVIVREQNTDSYPELEDIEGVNIQL